MNIGRARFEAIAGRMVAITAILAVAGCAHLKAPQTPPPDFAQLADEVLMHTPENIHYGGGFRLSWVLLDGDSKEAPAELIAAVREKLSQRYTVFNRESDLPASYISPDVTGKQYFGGFWFSFQVTFLGPDTVQIKYRDYEASLAGSGGSTTYRWQGSRWVVISYEPTWVS